MKKKALFDSIDVPKPCDKSWDEMIGGDVSRFCKHCEKDIYNISAMTRQEAKKLLFQSKEKVCIRMEREADGKIKTLKKQLHQITRQMPLAAGVLTASMILSGAANAQETKVESSKITITQTADKNSKPTISGTIKTIEEYVIPGVKVILRNVKDGSTRTTISDGEGLYEFKNVMPSVYTIETKDDIGFKDFIYPNLSIEDNKNMNLMITLVSNGKVELLRLDGINPGIKTSIPSPMDKNSKPTICGTITDSQGALLPGIKVILRNTKDNSIRTTVADKEGFYEFKDVEALNYDIEVVEKYPFKKFVYKNLVVTKEKNFDLTIVLELQSGVEVVGLVTTETPVKTDIPPINTNVTYQEIVPLPVSQNRTFMGLVLVPKKVKQDKNIQIKTSQISFTILDQNNYLVSGAKVILKNGKLKKEYVIFSNEEGLAKFRELPVGDYKIEISSGGFKKYKGKIKIKETAEIEIKINLITSNEVVGVFISKS